MTKGDIIKLLYAKSGVHIDVENQFTLKGGIISPLYVCASVFENEIDTRGRISSALTFWVGQHCHDIDAVVGVVSGGISWAACIANNKCLPLLRVHAHPKNHGLHNQVEGNIPFEGAKILVVDDIITTGNSALSVVKALREQHANVVGVISIFDWDFPAVNEKFKEERVAKDHIFSLSEVIDYGYRKSLLPKEAKSAIDDFIKSINR